VSTKAVLWGGVVFAIAMLLATPLLLQQIRHTTAYAEPHSTAPSTRNQAQDWIYFASKEDPEAQPPQLVLSMGGRTTTLPAAADTVLISYLADRAWGAHQQLSVDLGDANRVLLRFTAPDVSAAQLERADLTLNVRESQLPPRDPFEAGVYQVTGSWDESTTTWQNQPTFDPTPVATFTIGPEPGIVRVDITGLVRAWCMITPNQGLLIKVLEPLAGGLTQPSRPMPRTDVKADGPVPAYAQSVSAQWSSPDIALPPIVTRPETLPWPHESPELSAPERETLRKSVWVINNFPLFQYTNDNAYCHNGLDIVLDNGTPIHAIKDGYVKSTKYETVVIADARGDEPSWGWAYTHLGSLRVSEGEFVQAGTPIGVVHFEGLSHLHLERIYSQAPYWGEWHYAVIPDGFFTYPDEDPPMVETPFHFLKNMTNECFTPDASGTSTVSGDVDIVVGMREQGLYAHSRENGFGDRLAVAHMQYEIKNIQSADAHAFTSFDFSRLAVKEGVNAPAFNTQVTNVLYKHPRFFEPERTNYDKTLTYYVITNCPADEPPRKLTPELAQLAWHTAATDPSGKPLFPDGAYDVTVTAWDSAGHPVTAQTRVEVRNAQ